MKYPTTITEEQHLKIDAALGKVHTALNKLICKVNPLKLTEKEFAELEDAEEILNNVRTALFNLPEQL